MTDLAPTESVTDRAARVLGAVPSGLFIDGSWRDTPGSIEVEDPATHEVIGRVADASADDAVAALDAAVSAQAGWADTEPRARADLLRRVFDLMQERSEDLAVLISLEMGKSLVEARNEVRYAAEFFRWFSEEAVRSYGRWSKAPTGGGRIMTIKRPVGPCLLITPWNFPLAMGTRKIAPALAAGCTVVVKAAQATPLSMNALALLLEEAGVPAGTVNVVSSASASRVSGPLLADRRLRKLSFTGSTEVGKVLLAQAAENVLRTSMELGGNAPLIVFEDAELDNAVEQSYIAKMRNVGESCVAANRMYVHADVADEFATRLAARMEGARLGRGIDPGVDVGPLVDEAQRATVSELVDDAVHRGASVVTGGSAPDGPGYFYAPTVLTDVDPDSRLHREEIFGPVAPIYTFDDDDEALRLANSSEYGLVAYLFTENLGRTLRMSEQIEAGMVGINRGLISDPAAPFGGVKWSGLGREGSVEGLDEYVDLRYVGLP